MARWTKTIQIKEFLTSEDDAETIKRAADGIIDRLKDTDAPVGRLKKARKMADDDADTALLVFNDGMNRIYDWADDSRVWLA